MKVSQEKCIEQIRLPLFKIEFTPNKKSILKVRNKIGIRLKIYPHFAHNSRSYNTQIGLIASEHKFSQKSTQQNK